MVHDHRLYVHDRCTKHGWLCVGHQYAVSGQELVVQAGEADVFVELQCRNGVPDKRCWLGLISDRGETVWETYYDLAPSDKLFHYHCCQVVHRIERSKLSKPGAYTNSFQGLGDVVSSVLLKVQ